jgi:hypothetical protein
MLNLDLSAAYFTAADVALLSGVGKKRIDQWLERGVIMPTKSVFMPVRKRPMFSVIEVFKARLAKILGTKLDLTAPLAFKAGQSIAVAAQRRRKPTSAMLAEIADAGWMLAVKRSVERGKPLAVYAAISKSTNGWQCFIELNLDNFKRHFGESEPFLVAPVGAIFAEVYRDCVRLHAPENAAYGSPFDE